MSADIPPNQTIYVNNLYEKLNKEELKKCLYAVFSQFGKILDVVCLKTYRLRGQAWVVFADVSAATNALRSMQGFPFFDKPMRLTYAKTKSDAVAKLDKSFSEKDRKERAKKNAAARDQLMKRGKDGKAAGQGQPDAKVDHCLNTPVLKATAAAAKPQQQAGSDTAPPNKILFVQNLPAATTDGMLSMLFQQFTGFTEVRMVEARPGIAFVEFQDEMQASVALSGLQDFKITPTNAMQISYAKQ